MSAPTPTLAKLTRPRLYEALARERLFRLIDEHRRHPVIWIAAPPGAGKTTLVASYLESRNLPGIWYQIDSGDRDPASFFYYLGIAARTRSHGRKVRPLALLTPEYLSDLPAFSRRVFRELFAQLGTPSTLVLDNFQDASDSAALQEAMSAAFDEIPAGMQVFVISRAPIPDAYARLAANRAIALVEWDSLKFTSDEAFALLASTGAGADSAIVEALREQCDGWAAGLVLLAEQWHRGGGVGGSADADSLQQVFAYFAAQIFERSSEQARLLMLKLAFLPDMSESLAAQLTETNGAVRLLEDLYRRHLFTDRRRGKEATYQFHALFRAFLQHRAKTDLSPAQQGVIARRAGDLLGSENRPELAFPLFLDAGDVAAAERLIMGHAVQLIGQGRWKVVVEWIHALPQSQVEGNAWLLHWLGTAQIGIDPPAARAVLERAYARADKAGDRLCQIQIAAGMVEALFLEYNRFSPLDPWIPVLGMSQEPGFVFDSPEQELRAQSALLISATYRMPDYPGIERCAERVQVLLRSAREVNLSVIAATHLCLYGGFTGRLRTSAKAADIQLPMLDDPAVTVFARIFAWAVIEWFAAVSGETELGDRAIAANELIAREEGMHVAERFACVIGYFVDMDAGRVDSGNSRIERFARIFQPEQPYEAASIVNMRAYLGLFTGDPSLALKHGPEAFKLYDDAGSIPHILVGLNSVIWGCVEAGDEPLARQWMMEHERWSSRRNMEWSRWVLDAGEAMLALRCGNEPAVRHWLGRVFAVERHRFDLYAHMLSWSRSWAGRLASAAMERDIEPAHVGQFIREFRLAPPQQWIEHWPRPIRIRSLGQFEIRIDGKPLSFPGKAPRKPLALLQRLVCGDASGVRDQALMDSLWPEEDGDAARFSFRVTLHRLRKLLGHPDAIRSDAGLVSLDPRLVWVDKFAVQAVLPLSQEDVSHLEHIMAWYGGPLLASEDDSPWCLPARRQLESDVVRCVLAGVARQEDAGCLPQALSTAERGFSRIPGAARLAETLLRLLLASGRPQDAIDAHLRHLDARTTDEVSSPGLRQLYETALALPSGRPSVKHQ